MEKQRRKKIMGIINENTEITIDEENEYYKKCCASAQEL